MTVEQRSRVFFAGLFLGLAVLLYLFLRPYLPTLLFTGLLGFLFHPVYERALGWVKGRQGVAVLITLTTVVATFVAPLVLVGSLVAQVVSDVAARLAAAQPTDLLNRIVELSNTAFQRLPGEQTPLVAGDLVTYARDAASTVASRMFDSGLGLGSLVSLIPTIFIVGYGVAAIAVNYGRISTFLHDLSPLDDALDRLYVRRLKTMTLAMVRGTFVIAGLQALIAGLLLWIAGVPYAAFLALVCFVVSIIPVGAGIVLIPVGIVLLATGNVWQGLVVLIGAVTVVLNLDNILRPMLVPKESAIHPALTIVSLFAGVAHFGVLGVVYGPVFMVAVVTTIELYRAQFSRSLPVV